MAKTNFAMKQFNHQNLVKTRIHGCQTAITNIAFDARTDFKPIKWIGTQRT